MISGCSRKHNVAGDLPHLKMRRIRHLRLEQSRSDNHFIIVGILVLLPGQSGAHAQCCVRPDAMMAELEQHWLDGHKVVVEQSVC